MDSSNRRDNRPWALVTGASSGIGAALARELARHGHDLVLSARSRAPMEVLAEELRRLGANATIVTADLSRAGAAATLIKEIAASGVEIDVLINNAGLGVAGHFDRIDPARIGEVMQVNIVALTELTRLLLPGMVKRRRGKIMLVASTASFLPGPGMAVYFASKAYVRSLGEALAEELRGSGVTVNVLCPGATATDFFRVAGTGNSVMAQNLRRMMSAQDVAAIGYRGLARGKRVTVTGWLNRALTLAAHLTPHAITLPLTERMMRPG
jgi:short-subunit dehydrogenase